MFQIQNLNMAYPTTFSGTAHEVIQGTQGVVMIIQPKQSKPEDMGCPVEKT